MKRRRDYSFRKNEYEPTDERIRFDVVFTIVDPDGKEVCKLRYPKAKTLFRPPGEDGPLVEAREEVRQIVRDLGTPGRAREMARMKLLERGTWDHPMRVREVGTKEWYGCLDGDCPARSCFAPGPYQIPGATTSGSRNTGGSRLVCLRREYRGCPSPLPKAHWPPGEKSRWKARH